MRYISVISLMAIAFLAGSFATQLFDKAVVTSVTLDQIARGNVPVFNRPWYWNMPWGVWLIFALLLAVIIIVCQVADSHVNSKQTTNHHSDGPVK